MSDNRHTRRHAAAETPASSADSLQSLVEDAGLALGLIALAALASPVSQLTLSPVYGSIPASINHQAAIILSFLLGFLIHSLRGSSQAWTVLKWLPLFAAIVPAAEYAALILSEPLGIIAGPILAGTVSCHVLIMLSAYAAATIMARPPLARMLPSLAPSLIQMSFAMVPFILLEGFFVAQVPEIIALSEIFTPADVQLVIPAALILLCASGPIVVVSTWALLITTYLFNPHGSGPYALVSLDQSLKLHNWTLLARQWSVTGYISVLESRTDEYRVLRCDHSLLGGEWLLNDERRKQGWVANEPVYSVFSMLEAVRLVTTDTIVDDTKAKALVIGLGIGTAPKALLQHGIDTTIVELDPAVHDYATQFFGLPTNHTAILADAVEWTHQEARKDDFERPRYNYIIHDVFTGGAEPLPLFTASFLRNLRGLLAEDGVAAINYAGDLNMPLTKQVLNTIDLTFDRQCEVYSDDAARKDGSVEPFSNFIVFCRNSPGSLTFRQPKANDYLGSFSRQSYLLPKPAQRLEKTWLDSTEMLQAQDIRSWRKAQEESAKKHWTIMRTVLPARIWELY